MTNTIKTYKDLERRKELYEQLLQEQGTLVGLHVSSLKKSLNPFTFAARFIKKTFSKKTLTVPELLTKAIFPKMYSSSRNTLAGAVVKNTVPFLIKTLVVDYVWQNKAEWMSQFFGWVNRKKQARKLDKMKNAVQDELEEVDE